MTARGESLEQVEDTWSEDDDVGPAENVQVWVTAAGQEYRLAVSDPGADAEDLARTSAFLEMMQAELQEHGSKSAASAAARRTRDAPVLPAGETITTAG